MKCLVSGGAGFIGSHLCHELLSRGHHVRVLDNLATGNRRNLEDVHGEIDFIEGDIRNYRTVYNAMDGIEVVFHQAALPSVPRSIADPISSNDVNVGGTVNILTAAKDRGTRRIVFASSSSVYGNAKGFPRKEDQQPMPASPYAVSKLAGEYYMRTFAELFQMESICLRYFNVFGPYQDPDSPYAAVIPKFISTMIRGDRPHIYGDGRQSRDFTYISNVIEANIKAAEYSYSGPLVANCAVGAQVTLKELVENLNRILGIDIAPTYGENRPGDVRRSMADVALLRNTIGYQPVVQFEKGLERTVDHFRSMQRLSL